MRWPDEIRDPAELLPPPVDVAEDEIDAALALMDTLTVDELTGDEYRDRYTDAIAEIIEAKREDREPPAVPEPEKPAQIVDLMAALNESVQRAKAGRGEPAGDADVHELPQPKKAAKKQPTKKTAKKTAARKPRSA
jgi:DNA end-binding protein Ku